MNHSKLTTDNFLYYPNFTNSYSYQNNTIQFAQKKKVNHTINNINTSNMTNQNQRHIKTKSFSTMEGISINSPTSITSKSVFNQQDYYHTPFKNEFYPNITISSPQNINQNLSAFNQSSFSFDLTSKQKFISNHQPRLSYQNSEQTQNTNQIDHNISYLKNINNKTENILFYKDNQINKNQFQIKNTNIQCQQKIQQTQKHKQNPQQAQLKSEKSSTPTVNKNASQKRAMEFQSLQMNQKAQNLKKSSHILSTNKSNKLQRIDNRFNQSILNRTFEIQKATNLRENSISHSIVSQSQKRKKDFEASLEKFEISRLKNEFNRIKFENSQLKESNQRNLDKINQYKIRYEQLIEYIDYMEKTKIKSIQAKYQQQIKDLQKSIYLQKKQIQELKQNQNQNQKIIENLKQERNQSKNMIEILQQDKNLKLKIIENFEQDKKKLQNQIAVLKQEIGSKNIIQKQIQKMSSSLLMNNNNQIEYSSNNYQLSQCQRLLTVKKDKMKYSYYSIKSKEGDNELMNPEDCYYQILELFGIQKSNENSLNILIQEIGQLKFQLEQIFNKYQSINEEFLSLKEDLRIVLLDEDSSTEKKIMDCFNMLKENNL